MIPPLLQIDNILVSTEIVTECFCCDYATCRGICCQEGDSGAPMDIFKNAGKGDVQKGVGKNEAEAIREAYPAFKPLLSREAVASIEKNGFSVVDGDGDTVTPLVEGTEECAFCHMHPENGVMCAIEMKGGVKPVSCSLYPIRTKVLRTGILALNLHHWDICRCAFEKGRRENIRAYEFLKGPIVRAFGAEFYDALDAARKELDSTSCQ